MEKIVVQMLVDAGKQTKMVEFIYNDKERLVEPYSFRQLRNGIALYAIEQGQVKAFLVHKIQQVKCTSLKFLPIWPVELAGMD
jgi:hypothetical protein